MCILKWITIKLIICKRFKNNDYLLLVSQMPRFRHCIFSVFQLFSISTFHFHISTFYFCISAFQHFCNFEFLHFCISAFLHFRFSIPFTGKFNILQLKVKIWKFYMESYIIYINTRSKFENTNLKKKCMFLKHKYEPWKHSESKVSLSLRNWALDCSPLGTSNLGCASEDKKCMNNIICTRL